MKDSYGRPVTSIRVSLTDKCNLNCSYCHNEGQPASTRFMTPGEIEKILAVASEIDIRKVKFTGGEPLLRGDILEIISRASRHMDDVSLTTNGTLLAPIAQELRRSGLNRINVSLDVFCGEKHNSTAHEGVVKQALQGIKASIETGLHPVKVNIVMLPSLTLGDIFKTVKTVWKIGALPQLIGLVDANSSGVALMDSIEDYIASHALSKKEQNMHKRKVYTLKDGEGGQKEVEIVRSMHNTEFCANCTRIRITSGGFLKPCLMHNDGLTDILTPIRNNAQKAELLKLFNTAIAARAPYWR